MDNALYAWGNADSPRGGFCSCILVCFAIDIHNYNSIAVHMDQTNTIIHLYVPPFGNGMVVWTAGEPIMEIICPAAGCCEQIRCRGDFVNRLGTFRLVRASDNAVGFECDGLFRHGSLWRNKAGNRFIVGDRSLWRADELVDVL